MSLAPVGQGQDGSRAIAEGGCPTSHPSACQLPQQDQRQFVQTPLSTLAATERMEFILCFKSNSMRSKWGLCLFLNNH